MYIYMYVCFFFPLFIIAYALPVSHTLLFASFLWRVRRVRFFRIVILGCHFLFVPVPRTLKRYVSTGADEKKRTFVVPTKTPTIVHEAGGHKKKKRKQRL